MLPLAPRDRLKPGVATAHGTHPAAQAPLLPAGRNDACLPRKRGVRRDMRQRLARQVRRTRQPLRLEIGQQPLAQVADDAVSVFHDRRTDLKARRPREQELRRVAPVVDSSHPRDGNTRCGGRRHAAQRHGLHRPAGEAAEGAFAGDGRNRTPRIEIDAAQRVQGVDDRNGIRPCRPRSSGSRFDIAEGRKLDDNWKLHRFPHPSHDGSDGVGPRPDRELSPILRPSVRTRQIQFEPVHSRLLACARHGAPLLLVGASAVEHARAKPPVGIPALYRGQIGEPLLRGVHGSQLHIRKADNVVSVANGPDARRHVSPRRRLDLREGLDDGPAPAGGERALDHLPAPGGRRGRQ